MNPTRPKLDFALRCIVGGVLIAAAVTKIANPGRFLASIFAYDLPLLPDFSLRLTAVALPWLELFCGALLIANAWRSAARAWALVLFVIFLLSTGQAWARGLDITCGCMDLEALGLAKLSRAIETPAGACVKNIFLLGATILIGKAARLAERARLDTA